MSASICRDAGDSSRPCPFVAVCHEERQLLQHRYGLRGKDCWAFELLIVTEAYEATERQAIQEQA